MTHESCTQRSRRSVVAGAVWTVPVVALAAPAPAFAASSCSVAPSIPAFPSGGVQSGNGWIIDAAGSGTVGGTSPLDFSSSTFRCQGDAANGQTVRRSAIYTLDGLSVLAERTYKVTVAISYYSGHANTASHTLSLGVGTYVSPASPALALQATGFTNTAQPGVDFPTGTDSYTVNYTPSSAGPLRIAIGFSVSKPNSGTSLGDDITVTSIVATC